MIGSRSSPLESPARLFPPLVSRLFFFNRLCTHLPVRFFFSSSRRSVYLGFAVFLSSPIPLREWSENFVVEQLG